MEVEEVIVIDREIPLSISDLLELLREIPGDQTNARGHQQLHDPRCGGLDDEGAAGRAHEAVAPLGVCAADAHRDIGAGQFEIQVATLVASSNGPHTNLLSRRSG